MANEKVNKVVLGNETLIDLTGDTVSANNLLSGATAHDASGERIQGNVSVPTVLDDLSDVNASSPASGDVLFNDGTEWINKKITIEVTQAEYNALEAQGLVDPDVRYRINNGILTCAPVDDNDVSEQKTWSSDKIFSCLSHIGMIIHSTTLDTEAKVKAVYGGTTWIQHSGYMLRGASSGVVANSAVKTGGEDTHTLTIDEMPSHNHTDTYYLMETGTQFYGLATGNVWFNNNKKSTNTGSKGGGQAHNNLPSYKSVYIWERTA